MPRLPPPSDRDLPQPNGKNYGHHAGADGQHSHLAGVGVTVPDPPPAGWVSRKSRLAQEPEAPGGGYRHQRQNHRQHHRQKNTHTHDILPHALLPLLSVGNDTV